MPSYEFLNIAKTGRVAPAPARPSIKVEIEAPTVLGLAVELVGAQSDPLLGRFRLAEDRLRVERDAREAYIVFLLRAGAPGHRAITNLLDDAGEPVHVRRTVLKSNFFEVLDVASHEAFHRWCCGRLFPLEGVRLTCTVAPRPLRIHASLEFFLLNLLSPCEIVELSGHRTELFEGLPLDDGNRGL